MRKIAVLDRNTIDKIAAGEVVERPASVVKELVENSIDAGATAITVEITDGGKKLIRITDNGSGIEADQVPTAFLSHATSKIQKVEDLETIASLGFRGEALSSIAAVSQVELITKTPSAITGVRYVIQGGGEEKLEEMGAPEGTTFLVRNLFYNTPARSKFLKSDASEASGIASLMEQLALSHPEISFKYIQNKQVRLHTSGNYRVKDVIYSIYGRDIAKALLEVSYENDFMKVEGFAGKPEISRGNRTFENYYVNGRYVKNNIIAKAIEDAYKGFLMQHKFPFVSLHIQMTGNDLDVNVHPRKMEIRFARAAEVYDAVYQAVRGTLSRGEMIPRVSVGPQEKKPQEKERLARGDVPEPFETRRREQLHYGMPQRPKLLREEGGYQKDPFSQKDPFTKEERRLFAGTIREQRAGSGQKDERQEIQQGQGPKGLVTPPGKTETDGGPKAVHPDGEEAQKTVQEGRADGQETSQREEVPRIPQSDAPKGPEAEEVQEKRTAPQEAPRQLELFQEKLLAPESRSRHKLIGQLFETYWLVEFGDQFYIIDQHAAHEKVYYERFVRQLQEQRAEPQYISPPLIVSLSMEEETRLKANEKLFRDFGFEIEPFGGREYCISAVPSQLYGFQEGELFQEMLDHLAGEGEQDAQSLFTARLASMACKAAVKGNNRLSRLEAEKLLDELLTLDNPYHCPHGRPTIVAMTRTEIEKKFKRIL
ncbi:MAG: DNA mismatch repair endonuclease MutL [Eubacteriales bacterium]|nr:DNA mismatch repair endonuclease MutL [Eubacteriales bacterium]